MTIKNIQAKFTITALLAIFAVSPVYAYDAAWNGGKEDITQSSSEPEQDCAGGECSPIPRDCGPNCGGTNSSPVYTARGYLVWSDTDISFPASTRVGLKRTYNSFDFRAGLFGRGWMTAQETNIVRTYKAITEGNADGSPTTATEFQSIPILLTAYGRRYKLEETANGFNTPAILYFSFEKLADGRSKQVYEDSASYQIYGETGLLLENYSDRDGTTIYYEYDLQNRLTRQYDSYGYELTFLYNEQGFVSLVTDQANRTWQYSYDTSGTLAQVVDPDGNSRDYSYQMVDKIGYKQYLLTDINDNLNDPVLNVTWDEIILYNNKAMRVSSFTEFDGLRHHYLYSESTFDNKETVYVDKSTRRSNSAIVTEQHYYQADRATYWILSNNNSTRSATTTYTHDGRGKLTGVSDQRDGNAATSTLHEYNQAGRRIKTTERAGTPDERVITRTYFNNSNRVATINEYGLRETRYEYDSDLRVTKKTQVDLSNSDQRIWVYTYHPNSSDSQGNVLLGKVASVDSPLPGTEDSQRYLYNTQGMLLQVNLPLGQSVSYTYNAVGQMATSTDVNGVTTTLTYDSQNRLIQTQRSGRTQQYSYTAQGQLEQATDTLGRVTNYSFNEQNDPTNIIFPSGDYVTFSYGYEPSYTEVTTSYHQADDSLISTSVSRRDPITGQTTNQYLTSTLHTERISQAQYNSRGDATDVTDFVFTSYNSQVQYSNSYDIEGRLTQTKYAYDRSTTNYGYDLFDNLTEVAAHNGATTQYNYTALGNLTQLVSPDTGTSQYQYDAAGNLASQTNANSVNVAYEYDALNRISRIDYQDDALDTQLTYDEGQNGKGRLTSITDGSGSTQYQYNAHGQLSQASSTVAGVQFNSAFAYNDAGQLTQITYPSGMQVAYSYDAAGRLSTIQRTIAQQTDDILGSVTWHGASMASFQHGNGLTTTLNYDASGRLIEKQYGSADNRLQNMLGKQGKIHQQTFTRDGVDTTSYHHYDTLGRLVRDGSGIFTYIYDAVGNRTRRNDANPPYVRTDSTYDAESNRLNKMGANDIQLDAAGNTLNDGVRQYQYNTMNRMSSLSHSQTGVQVSYTYNNLGQRVRKRYTSGEAIDVRYVYGLSGELLGEYDAQGSVIKEYIYQQGGVSELVAQIESDGSILYIHTDHLATPRLATRADKTIVWRWVSTAFGETLADEEPDGDASLTVVNHRFPGQYFDGESGLHYNYYRYYDPRSGRYVTSDPIGLGGGLNTYLYANANSLQYYDLYGEWSDPDPCKCEKWLEKEKNIDWTNDLPACPCTLPDISRNPKWGGGQKNPKYHPGAKICIRSTSVSARQQCCYDKSNNLITDGEGAGTPDKKGTLFAHMARDVNPWYLCGWEKYNTVRPPNNANNCSKNPK